MSSNKHEFTSKQLEALEALARGCTVTDAAKTAGVHRSTVHNWCTDITGFRAALRHSKTQTAQRIEDGFQSMATLALDTMRHLLESEKTPASIKLKAAQSILDAIKNLAVPQRLPCDDQIEHEMRTALEESAMTEALFQTAPEAQPELEGEAMSAAEDIARIEIEMAQALAEPEASPSPAGHGGIRHNSTLSTAPWPPSDGSGLAARISNLLRTALRDIRGPDAA